jgi:hypothetical protein
MFYGPRRASLPARPVGRRRQPGGGKSAVRPRRRN